MTRAKSKPPREVWVVFNSVTGRPLDVDADRGCAEARAITWSMQMEQRLDVVVPCHINKYVPAPAKRQRGKK